jgi:hypothetical protein
METFLSIANLFVLICTTCMIFSLFKKIEYIETRFEFFTRKFITTLDTHGEDFDRLERHLKDLIEIVKNDNDRSLQAILERLDAAKPIRPNNWDSIKEAFKGPARVEINERN